MITWTNKMAAVALLATVALAGCGSEDEPIAATTAPAAVATTPAAVAGSKPAVEEAAAEDSKDKPKPKQAAWANKLCTAMAGEVSEVTPPNMNAGSPAAVQQSLVTFFNDITTQLGTQIATIEKVGPPSESKLAAEWKKSVSDLGDVRKEVSQVADNIEEATPKTDKELAALVQDLGTQMKSLGEYQGALADLSSNPALGAAIEAEPACAKIS